MDGIEERKQLEELRVHLKRAERNPNRTAAVRKDVLKRLIEVVQSPYTSLKNLAASSFRLFIKDFPELEDDAINAVYDLCEDSDGKVRIDGYQAIVSVSKEQKKWVKRNADVLVQLLQSDEPEEVVVVKKALIEHLDMDPVVTLGVLCDQIIPPEQYLDEEDQAIRDRLRSLVLAFLTGEAHRGITERHVNALGSPAEDVLVSGVFKAIPNLPHTDIEVAVKDLLLSLSSFGRLSKRGDQLLEIVLDTAKSSLKAELASTIPQPPVPRTTFFLNLASFIANEKRVADPRILLRFYGTSVLTKLTLIKLAEDAKVLAVSHVADSLVACDEASQSGFISRDEMILVRKLVVDLCPLVLPCFLDIKSEVRRPWKSCCILVDACKRRKDETTWKPPSVLTDILQIVQDAAEAELTQGMSTNKAIIQQAQSLIRPLLPPKDTANAVPTTIVSTVNARNAVKDKSNGTPVTIQRNRESNPRSITVTTKPGPLPPKPLPAFNQEINGANPRREDRQRLSAGSMSVQVARQLGAASSASTSAIHDVPVPRTFLRNDNGSPGAPSLLSRLTLPNMSLADLPSSQSSTPSIPAKRRAEPERTPRRQSFPVQSTGAEEDMDPAGGWSIRGAATRKSFGELTAPAGGISSLLNRLEGDGDGDWRGKKRTRNF